MATSTKSGTDEFIKGLWRENPVFVQVLGMCPVLAVSNTALNALAMGLATAFSQTLGQIFSHEPKPFEVEMLICEVGLETSGNRMFKITYDGTLYDQRQMTAIGGKSEAIEEALREGFQEGMSLQAAFDLGVSAFRAAEDRDPDGWEIAVLERGNGRRTFRRIDPDDLTS